MYFYFVNIYIISFSVCLLCFFNWWKCLCVFVICSLGFIPHYHRSFNFKIRHLITCSSISLLSKCFTLMSPTTIELIHFWIFRKLIYKLFLKFLYIYTMYKTWRVFTQISLLVSLFSIMNYIYPDLLNVTFLIWDVTGLVINGSF